MWTELVYAAAAGVEVRAERALDGMDLWGEISSGQAAPRSDDIFYASETALGRQFSWSVLRGNLKLVQKVDQTFESLTIVNELYDVFADPGETNDLAGANPDLVRELVDALIGWRRQHPYAGSHARVVPHPGWRAPLDWARAMELNGLNVNPNPGDNIYGMGQPGQPGQPSAVQQRLDRMYGDRGRTVYK